MELGRFRFSVTSGNVMCLLKQISGSVSYLEKRSCSALGRCSDFWSTLKTDILEFEWKVHEVAEAALGNHVAQFFEAKLNRGMSLELITSLFKAEFSGDLHTAIMEGAKIHYTTGNKELLGFWTVAQTEYLLDLSVRYHWWQSDQKLQWYV